MTYYIVYLWLSLLNYPLWDIGEPLDRVLLYSGVRTSIYMSMSGANVTVPSDLERLIIYIKDNRLLICIPINDYPGCFYDGEDDINAHVVLFSRLGQTWVKAHRQPQNAN